MRSTDESSMEDFAVGTAHRPAFVRYLADTVEALTPRRKPMESTPGNWEDYVFDSNQDLRNYCRWLAGILGFSMRTTSTKGEFGVADPPQPEANYGFISLNYDMVLETCLDIINEQIVPNGGFKFRTTTDGDGVPLAKIHGSVNPLSIVPPTWQKAARPEVLEAWRLAAHLLTEANHVRILGFSFPETDGYVKYLLSLGAMRAPHLKNVDVICLDDADGTVQARYDRFINFPGFRFSNADLRYYMSHYSDNSNNQELGEWNGFRRLKFRNSELYHHAAMRHG